MSEEQGDAVSPATVVTLDVGGTIFKSRVETLARARYFHNLFRSDRWTPARTDEPLFVDRCPRRFERVLQFLRDDRYPVDEDDLPELDFYGVEWERPKAFQDPKTLLTDPLVVRCGVKGVQLGTELLPKDSLIALLIQLCWSMVRKEWQLEVSVWSRSKRPFVKVKDGVMVCRKRFELRGRTILCEYRPIAVAGGRMNFDHEIATFERIEKSFDELLSLLDCEGGIRKCQLGDPPIFEIPGKRRTWYYIPSRVDVDQLEGNSIDFLGCKLEDADAFRAWFLIHGDFANAE